MANGSMWVEGTYLHWRNASNTEYRFDGTVIATPSGATVGSLWIEANNVHYIDASGVERQVGGPYVSSQAGLAGSMWMDSAEPANEQLHWLGEAQHEHYAHSDTSFVNTHTNTHSDSHVNTHVCLLYTSDAADE